MTEIIVRGVIFELETWSGKYKCPMWFCKRTLPTPEGVRQHMFHEHVVQERLERECPVCNEIFPTPRDDQWYCSPRCVGRAPDVDMTKHCIRCGDVFDVTPANVTRRYCTTACAIKEHPMTSA